MIGYAVKQVIWKVVKTQCFLSQWKLVNMLVEEPLHNGKGIFIDASQNGTLILSFCMNYLKISNQNRRAWLVQTTFGM